MARNSRAACPTARLPGLELLRWIAALSVLLFHLPVIFGLRQVFARGYLGVDLFFMLSGYVLAHGVLAHGVRAHGHDRRPATAVSAARFVRDRYSRMWPVMALGGLIGWPLLHARLPDLARALPVAAANLLLVPFAFGHQAYPLNVPAWTIMFILLGNLLHRLVLYRLDGRALAFAILASAVAMGLAARHAGSFDVGSRPQDMVLALPRLMLAYLIGIAICKASGDSPPLRVPPLAALSAMPVVIVSAWYFGVSSWLFDMGFVMLACPLIIIGALRWHSAARWAGFAGAWSFPLYAIHFPLLIRLRNDGATPWQAALAALAVSALVTWAEIRLRAAHRTAGGWRALLAGTARAILRPAFSEERKTHGPILHR